MPPQKKSATNAQNVGKQDKQDGKGKPHKKRGGDPFTGGGGRKAEKRLMHSVSRQGGQKGRIFRRRLVLPEMTPLPAFKYIRLRARLTDPQPDRTIDKTAPCQMLVVFTGNIVTELIDEKIFL